MILIEKLDTILKYIVENQTEKGYADANLAYHYLKKTYPDIANWQVETYPLIAKLEKDGYAKFQYTETPIDIPDSYAVGMLQEWRATVNIDGLLFIQNGGYTKAHEIEVLKERTDNLNLKRQIHRDNLLIGGSWAAGIGTLILAIVEIWKICHSCY